MLKKFALKNLFDLIIPIILILIAFICIFPLLNILAVSFSSSSAAAAGSVSIWPIDFNLKSYQYLARNTEFWRAYIISIERVLSGTALTLMLTIITAYPLSKEKTKFKFRNVYMWIIFITALFYGGLVPTYMVISSLGLINKFVVLILYYAIQPFNIIILMNFYKQIPPSLSESAYIDGAGHWRILWNIFIPMAKPAIAAITLFIVIFHWSSYFDGLIYLNDIKKYPLQTYLQSIIVIKDAASMAHASKEELAILAAISDRTTKAAQLLLSSIPILIVYPFVQKYFIKGITLGSVKE